MVQPIRTGCEGFCVHATGTGVESWDAVTMPAAEGRLCVWVRIGGPDDVCPVTHVVRGGQRHIFLRGLHAACAGAATRIAARLARTQAAIQQFHQI